MPERPNPPRRGRRRVPRIIDLERRVERLESEVEWLRRVVEAQGEIDGGLAVGPCPNCPTGVLMRYGDELRCDACGYSHFL